MTTIADILSAIDAGDRTALWPLADMLLESGDARGDGVRWLAEQGKWPDHLRFGFAFHGIENTFSFESTVPWKVFCAIRTMYHQYISAAILDAAQAVVSVGLSEVAK